MASTLKLKKSSVVGKVPLTTDLDYGELAINYQDGKLFYKNAGNSVVNITDSRTASTASGATITPTAGASDVYEVTALATDATVAAPSGTPVANQKLLLKIKDDGTARTLTWDPIYRGINLTIPTTTTSTKVLYVGCIYNAGDLKWDILAVAQS